MDPNIMKFFEEDEDESMHSGADVDAFTAELNRDIEGNTSTSQQYSEPVAVSQGSSQTKSQFHPPWPTSTHNRIGSFGSAQDPMFKEQHVQQSSQLEQQQQLQDMSNQHSVTSYDQQTGTAASKLNKQVSLGMLLQIIQPQLDKDRVMPVHNLYFRLKKNEISKDGFFRHMRSIVGDQMLKLAAYKLQNQAAGASQSTPDQFQSHPQASARQLQMSSGGQIASNLSHPASESNKGKSHEVENQANSMGVQTSYPTYGSAGSSYSSASSTSFRLQPHDSQMRQAPAHHMGPTTQSMNVKNMSNFDRSHSSNDPKKMHQNPVQWPPPFTGQEQKIGVSTPVTYVKQESVDQSTEQQHKSQTFSSTPRPTETSILPKSVMPSPSGPGNSSKGPTQNPSVGQKKSTETPDSSSSPSSKKQKVSGAFLDQSIEQLNDVTAVSGVNLREEEEQLFSGPKEDNRVSEACRLVVQEEEERLILHKIPLQKKVVEIMAKYGLKSMSNDVPRCLSLCVEERLRGLISNLIRLSKQHVDIEKQRHRTRITSNVRQKIMTINRNAHEEWEKKQAETEKSHKLDEPESSTGVDGDKEKEDSRIRPAKANKEEDDKMRATAANVAVRAATGVGDMLSRWQSMIDAKHKKGRSDTSCGSQPGKDAQKPLPASTRNMTENQEEEKQDHSSAFDSRAASARKVGRNQVMVPRAWSITVKDVIAILEREPQMLKSTLIYRLYDNASADGRGE